MPRAAASPPEPPPQPHDALFRWTFSQRKHAAGLLRAALPPAWSAEADFRTLRLENGAFVSRALRRRHSDLVFSVLVRGRKAYFYVLVEHQKKVEALMVVRMGIYVMRLYDEMLRDHPRRTKVPPIVPLLVHHSKTGWKAKTAFQEVVDIDEAVREALWRYLPHYEMRVVDLHDPTPANLEPDALTAYGRVVLAVLAAAGDEARLRRAFAELGREIGQVFGGMDGRDAFEALVRYIAGAYQRLKPEQIAEMVESAAGSEAEEVVVTWLEEIELRGKKELLLAQLAARFGAVPTDARARVSAADDTTLTRWAVRVLTATSVDDVLSGGRKIAPARKAAHTPTRKPAARAPARRAS